VSRRLIVTVFLVAIGALTLYAWRRSQTPAEQAAGSVPQQVPQEMPPPSMAAADAGIDWKVPAAWSTLPGRGSMRLATYGITGHAGAQDAECAVFYFGPGQGGTTEANLERWVSEFENPKPPERWKRTIGGMTVTRVHVSGTYSSHGGSMGAVGETPHAGQADYGLLGAIVEGPAGSVFFKLTGPAATVAPAAKDFDKMLESMKKK
jgi:hypothetical protein